MRIFGLNILTDKTLSERGKRESIEILNSANERRERDWAEIERLMALLKEKEAERDEFRDRYVELRSTHDIILKKNEQLEDVQIALESINTIIKILSKLRGTSCDQ